MTNVNNLIDKTWDRQKFIDRQRRRKKYRFFIRIKNRIILYWLDFKDIFNCSQRNADKISCECKNRNRCLPYKGIIYSSCQLLRVRLVRKLITKLNK